MNKTEILDSVNWEAALAAPRYAGGHEDVMGAIFEGRAVVLSSWVENDYQGELAYAYEFPDGTIIIITDYFGSCSGCDSWEGASDEDARAMITSMVTSGRVFSSRDEARAYCSDKTNDAFEFSHSAARNLTF